MRAPARTCERRCPSRNEVLKNSSGLEVYIKRDTIVDFAVLHNLGCNRKITIPRIYGRSDIGSIDLQPCGFSP